MLIISEIQESTFRFRLFRDRKFLKELYVNTADIVTSEDLPGFRDKSLTLTLKYDSSTPVLEASKPVLINGVACREKRLKPEDKIFLGPYRLVFAGRYTEPEEIEGKPARKFRKTRVKKSKLPYIAEAAAVLISISFLWYCSTQRPLKVSGTVQAPPETEITHEAPPPKEAEIKEKPPEKEQPEQPAESIQKEILTVYAPEEMPPYQKTDILLFHAHPDDETLDYGIFIAKAAAEGKKIAVVTFTDGEAGFDFYPDRSTGGIYPDKELYGKELSAVRIIEEERALKILGASIYIRLGLKNRPYTPEEASKSVSSIIDEWGGENQLIDRLINIITRLDPDIIVSPDGPSGAREHFEHESTGYICGQAVKKYIRENPGRLKAYLKLIDVQQTDAYDGFGIMTAEASGDKEIFVKKKRDALLQYETQADASYYGVKRLENFPFEYYFAAYKPKTTKIALLPEVVNNAHRQ